MSDATANPHLTRAWMLFDQSRYEMAEQELRQALARNPDDATAHALLALCLVERGRLDEANREVQAAIGLAPDQPFPFYAQSFVCGKLNHWPEAEAAIREAIGMNSFESSYFARWAAVLYQQRRWKEAAEAAKQGLALDPEDDDCTNLHAMALVKLGQRVEAGDAIASALRRNPEDTNTHANMGWAHLESGRPRPAMEHFRESLRLDPQNEWARTGIIEAMKARNIIYRLLLAWFLWMTRLSGQARWGVILGAYAGYHVLRAISRGNPALAPWIMPLLVAYIVFVVATWVAAPLFNLVLRLDRFGRLALNREETITSNWVGLCVLGAMIFIVAYFVTGWTALLMGAAAFGLLLPAVAHIYSCQEGWPRVAVMLMAIGLAAMAAMVVGALMLSTFASEAGARALEEVAELAFLPFLLGAIASQFAINALASVRPRHGGMSTKQAWLIGGGALAACAVLFALMLASAGWATYRTAQEPVRFTAIPDGSLAWEDRAALDRETASLEQVGFQILGDYRLVNAAGEQDHPAANLRSRVLFHEEQSTLAELLENPKTGLVCLLTTHYHDGGKFACTNGREKGDFNPNELFECVLPGATSAELFRHMLQQRPTEKLLLLTAEQARYAYEN